MLSGSAAQGQNQDSEVYFLEKNHAGAKLIDTSTLLILRVDRAKILVVD